MKTVKVRKKAKIFLESVFKTIFYVKRAPLNSYVGSLTIPLNNIDTGKIFTQLLNSFVKLIWNLNNILRLGFFDKNSHLLQSSALVTTYNWHEKLAGTSNSTATIPWCFDVPWWQQLQCCGDLNLFFNKIWQNLFIFISQ